MHEYLVKAANLTGVELPALEKASDFSDQVLDRFKEGIRKNLSFEGVENADIVLLGSIARGEFSKQSDCDYFVLQNGAPPSTTQALIRAAEEEREKANLAEPGAQGVFAQIAVAANLFESIGLDFDTNTNMTRRILLLSESKPVTLGKTHATTIKHILSRYPSVPE